MRYFLVVAFLVASGWAWPDSAPELNADQIMQRVAANQDQAEALRRQYVYKQHVHVASRKTNGKLMCEETADYDVFPGADTSTKKLKQFAGKHWTKNQYVSYAAEPTSEPDDVDGSIVFDMRDDLVNEKKSKDGIAVDLFPLTSRQQAKYRFKLLPEQTMNGYKVYRIWFEPKDKNDSVWSGEAFIEKTDFQPVMVFTKMSRKVPFVIRTALGTDVPGVGFSITYKRQPDGVWFPATFGTEFRLRALFFINREITMSLVNSDFEHTHVDSTIHYAGVQ